MRSRSLLVLGLVVGLAAGCGRSAAPARVLPPAPCDTNGAALGVTVSLQAPGGALSTPEVIYFARLEDGEVVDTQQAVVASNFAAGGRFYLLNAAPGTYVAVAAAQERDIEGLAGHVSPTGDSRGDSLRAGFSFDLGKAKTRTHRTYFAHDAIERSRVRVEPGAFTYMGDLKLEISTWTGKADAAQTNYQRVVEGDPALRMGRSALALPWLGALATASRDPASEGNFLDAARHDLGSSGWAERLTQRQRDLERVLAP